MIQKQVTTIAGTTIFILDQNGDGTNFTRDKYKTKQNKKNKQHAKN